ncbi:MAG: DNA repair protein RadC [Bacteroidaceae bacterium]|nr:DNA repair protein RadC [Bacteroidaceae bacterium]
MGCNKDKRSIKEWPVDERPREKVLRCGASALSKSELLAILIGSGSADESAVELMKKVMASCGDSMAELARMSVDELCRFKGIGPAKAITIVAACELWKRRQADELIEKFSIRSSDDLFKYFYPLMCDLTVEESYVLLLNNRNRVIDNVRIATGGLTSTIVDIRLVMREALVKRATTIALCHNHPSGNLRPSSEDDRLTQNIVSACKIMNIRFLDHIIVAGNKYYSYNDESRL